MLREMLALGAAAVIGAAIASAPNQRSVAAYALVLEGKTARVTLLQTSATATYTPFLLKDSAQYAGYSPGLRVVALVESLDPEEDANLSIGDWSVSGAKASGAYAEEFIGDVSAAREFRVVESVLNAPAPATQIGGRRYLVDFHGLGKSVNSATAEVTLHLGFGVAERFTFSAVPMPQ